MMCGQTSALGMASSPERGTRTILFQHGMVHHISRFKRTFSANIEVSLGAVTPAPPTRASSAVLRLTLSTMQIISVKNPSQFNSSFYKISRRNRPNRPPRNWSSYCGRHDSQYVSISLSNLIYFTCVLTRVVSVLTKMKL